MLSVPGTAAPSLASPAPTAAPRSVTGVPPALRTHSVPSDERARRGISKRARPSRTDALRRARQLAPVRRVERELQRVRAAAAGGQLDRAGRPGHEDALADALTGADRHDVVVGRDRVGPRQPRHLHRDERDQAGEQTRMSAAPAARSAPTPVTRRRRSVRRR